MQNGFVKAYRSLHRFRAGAAFRPLAAQDRRQRGAQRAPLGATACEARGARGREARTSTRADADEAVIAREEVDVVLAALGRLSETDRLALALRYFAELPDREAAEPRRCVDGGLPGPARPRAQAASRRLLESGDG